MDIKNVNHSPHIFEKTTTSGIMLDVIIALLPTTLAGFVIFGPRAICTVFVTVLSAILSEYVMCKIMKKPNSLYDLSAVVTGLLLGLNLPPEIPVFMAVIGSVTAIVVVKMMFGGLGQNFANPAIVGRIVLLLSFTKYMTSWTAPFAWYNGQDAVTSATPLVAKEGTYSILDLLLGNHGGTIGEVSSLMIIIGGIYLTVRKVIKPAIPLSFILTVAALSLAFGSDPLYAVLSGGVLLGSVFMATDYVTSPSGILGGTIFGIGCGLLTIIIRHFGRMPEGVSYAILIMNFLTPYIENLTGAKPFGREALKNG